MLKHREVEYSIANIKSEGLNHLPIYNYLFDKIQIIIDDYIKWYNNKRKVDCNEKHQPKFRLMQSKV